MQNRLDIGRPKYFLGLGEALQTLVHRDRPGDHMGSISLKIKEIAVVMVAHPLPILAPKMFKNARTSEVEISFLVSEVGN